MKTESREPMDRAIAAMLRIPPIMHRKILREVFARGQHKAGIDIAHHHVMIMKMLEESGTLNSSEIGAVTSISKAQMTHSTGKLAALGLIEKQPDAGDRRKFNLRLTPKGQATIQRMDEIMIDLLRERLSSLSDDELEKLAESFEYIAELFLKLK